MFKNLKVVYVAGFVLLTLFGAYYYQDILFGDYQPKKTPNQTSVVDTVERKFNVDGMFCISCKNKIEKAVQNLPGVVDVDVTPSSNEMVVTYDKSNENVQQTLSTVKNLGYTPGLKSNTGKLQVLDFNVTFK
ncbi:MAG: heavy metal-associated domain-containing protein [Candidatus Margulisiibacteriota bacterium]|nr:heavy metal-associated domain-containing protein [Candidatus Margulisiibacteriota bacterium]